MLHEQGNVQDVSIQSESGSQLAGWWIQHPASRGAVVLLHPIRSDRRAMLGRAAMLYDAGYSSLLVDLQAHGESPGQAITLGHLEAHDAKAAVDWVRQQDSQSKVGIVGWSLGGAAALLAEELTVDAMVLESVYPSIEQATHNRVEARLGALSDVVTPLLLCQLRPRLRISPAQLQPIAKVSSVTCPLLLLTGDQDRHTTLAEAQAMHAAAPAPKQIYVFQGAAHEDLHRCAPDAYRETVLRFLETSFEATFEREGK